MALRLRREKLCQHSCETPARMRPVFGNPISTSKLYRCELCYGKTCFIPAARQLHN
jgi:hypothetical protein